MDLYEINSSYIRYLQSFDNKVLDNHKNGKIRPYVGIIIEINNINYFIPLSSPKQKHINMKENIDLIKIFDLNNKTKLISILNITNMIPAPINQISKIDINLIPDEKYKSLISIEIIEIRKKKEDIIKKAKIVYKLTTEENNQKLNPKLKDRCCDYLLLEEKMKEYKNP